MKFLLISPPIFNPFQPPLGIAVLTAFLKSQGLSVTQKDLNIDFFNFVFNSQFLHSLKQIDKQWRNIEKLPKLFQQSDSFFDLSTHINGTMLLNDVFNLYMSHFVGGKNGFQGYGLDSLAITSERILIQRLSDYKTNPFLLFFSNIVPHLLEKEKPDAIGISVTHEDQLLPALTLSGLIKRSNYSIPVYIGGSTISYLRNRLLVHPNLVKLATAFIAHEGEIPLTSLLAGEKLCKVPNLIYENNGKVIRTAKCGPIAAGLDPVPDFGGLDLGSYFTPMPVLPYNIARCPCPHGKCAFCNTRFTNPTDGGYKSAGKVFSDIKALTEKHNCHHFTIYDECVPIALLTDLCKSLTSTGVKRYLFCAIRSSERISHKDLHILRRGGFVHLAFGFESVSDRMLTIFNKARNHAHMMNILRGCISSKISVFLTALVGFAGETADEARSTIDFFNSGRMYFDSAEINLYSHEEGSPAWNSPSKYNIFVKNKKRKYGLFDKIRYANKIGISQKAAMLLLKQHSISKNFSPLLGTPSTLLYLSRFGYSAVRNKISAFNGSTHDF